MYVGERQGRSGLCDVREYYLTMESLSQVGLIVKRTEKSRRKGEGVPEKSRRLWELIYDTLLPLDGDIDIFG